MKFYVTSTSYNVIGEPLDVTLCEYNGEISWKQPSFQRLWSEKMFLSEYDALCEVRKMYPERLLTIFENTGKIISTHGPESGFTTIVIRREESL